MKWKTIIISAFALMVLLVGCVFYYASHRINGEELRKFMISSLEDVFPYARVDMGEVDLKFGSSLNLVAHGLSLTLVEEKPAYPSELFKIERVGIEIPLGVLLGLEQSITVNLDGALVNFLRSGGKNNWQKAYQGGAKGSPPSGPAGKTAMAPAFLTNGKINIKFTDTRLNYNLDEKQKGEVLINYFRVNNLGIESNAAYELKSDLFLKFSRQAVDMELSLIGQFSPSEFIRQGVLKTTAILTVGKMYFTGQDVSVPGFKTDIKLELSNAGEVTAKLATTLNDKNYINALLKTRDKKLLVEDIDLVFYLDELLDILKVDMTALNVGDGRIEMKGDFSLGSQLRPNVVFSVGPKIGYNYNNKLFSGELKGKYQDKSLVMGITSKGLGGEPVR